MNDIYTQPLLEKGGIIFMGLYLFSLIGIGLVGRMAQKEKTLSDFYLAGRGMGVFVLFLTLYATQYSGNTLIGFAGKAYRTGFSSFVTILFMSSIIGAYLLYAPKLFRLSKKYNFITIGDFIQRRFNSTKLTITISILAIIALGNYILTNLKAIGFIVTTTTGGAIPFAEGIIFLSLIMVIYETLGGMRSVAWTDVIQGILLMLGVILIFYAIQTQFGGLIEAERTLKTVRPDFYEALSPKELMTWISTMIIVFFGISVYPHAIQRIYAAKDEKTLKQSFQIMVFMPLVTTFFMVYVGIVGASKFPGLDRAGSETVTLLLLNDLSHHLPWISSLLVLFISAAIAAVMSTVDSALLAVSSLATQDFYRRLKPNSDQRELTYIGKMISWLVMAFAVVLAIKLPQTIWKLFEIKLELLCQIAPAIFLGVHSKRLSGQSVFYGIIVGTTLALLIMISHWTFSDFPSKPLGVHGGVWGLIANVFVIWVIEKKNSRVSSL